MGMGGISIWQLLIVLVIVLLVFGTKRITGLGSDLGNAIKGFRSAMKDGEEDNTDPQKLEQADPKGPAVDVAASKAAAPDAAAPKTAAPDAAGADKHPPKA